MDTPRNTPPESPASDDALELIHLGGRPIREDIFWVPYFVRVNVPTQGP